MVNNQQSYKIIDEPKARVWCHLIINPNIILFAAMLVPLFWQPPLYGRFWMPLLWIVFNGFLLGSSTFKREVITCVLGILTMAGLGIWLLMYYQAQDTYFTIQQIIPYYKLLNLACLFLTLYISVFTQSTSYQLFEYMHRSQK
ncbi:MAG: hypothetical protein HRU38_14895 [Saccharospirillaceae bacterium]|nr:hypothetical protein [Pseudomonadales bacterium]NRB79929.1 hypothetical protein [Saccharospirillaceae bacterium]